MSPTADSALVDAEPIGDAEPMADAGAPADGGADPMVGSNTNVCLADLGRMQPICPTEEAPAAPTRACCEAFREFQMDACSCSPFVELLLRDAEGDSRLATLVAGLGALCPATGVELPTLDCEALVTPSGISSGVSRTYAGGACPHGDAEMDALRFGTLLTFGGIFGAARVPDQCLDTPGLIEALQDVAIPEVEVHVPYGVGVYKGFEDVAEYLGIAFVGLNHGMWLANFVDIDPTEMAALEVSTDGGAWTQGATSDHLFMNVLEYEDAFTLQSVTFEGCDTRFSRYEVLATEGIRGFVEHWVWAASLFDRWGAADICRYHTEFCADDPETRQYESEEACRAFISSLPLYSEACGINRPMAGLSLPCKFKHHFMIPSNPRQHCPHIGPPGARDPDEHLKCDDETECGDPDQGADWPLVTRIGDETPPEVLEAAALSNMGADGEPLGCAVPTAAE